MLATCFISYIYILTYTLLKTCHFAMRSRTGNHLQVTPKDFFFNITNIRVYHSFSSTNWMLKKLNVAFKRLSQKWDIFALL